jgi:hypothetical protein
VIVAVSFLQSPATARPSPRVRRTHEVPHPRGASREDQPNRPQGPGRSQRQTGRARQGHAASERREGRRSQRSRQRKPLPRRRRQVRRCFVYQRSAAEQALRATDRQFRPGLPRAVVRVGRAGYGHEPGVDQPHQRGASRPRLLRRRRPTHRPVRRPPGTPRPS